MSGSDRVLVRLNVVTSVQTYFTARLEEPPLALLQRASLLLDFDGTLVEIAARPDAVVVPRELPELILELHARLDGRVAVISGRPAREVQALLGCPAHVVGSHGLEFAWADRAVEMAERPDGLKYVLAAMHGFAASRQGVLVEDKPLGAALHFRSVPELADESIALATQLADEHGLNLQAGKMMIEVRVGGGDKGSAIRRIMLEPGFAGTHPVFLGDDVTDEAGFAVAAELGGGGVLVGDERESAAHYRLPDVARVRQWLAEAMGRQA
jgi:trehalose 6-phosphate phosphatase